MRWEGNKLAYFSLLSSPLSHFTLAFSLSHTYSFDGFSLVCSVFAITIYELLFEEHCMFIVKHITTGDVVARKSTFDAAIAALREFLERYTKVNDHEVEIVEVR